MIQLTGRANYRSYGEDLGVDLTEDDKWDSVANNPRLAADVAGWFWERHELNEHADNDDVKQVTRTINGGYNSLADRKDILNRAKIVLGIESDDESSEAE